MTLPERFRGVPLAPTAGGGWLAQPGDWDVTVGPTAASLWSVWARRGQKHDPEIQVQMRDPSTALLVADLAIDAIEDAERSAGGPS